MDSLDIAKSKPLKELPSRLHHYGHVVKDQEVNRQFMEDLLGIPLRATWCEIVFNSELNRKVEFCHTFYEVADGSALAFFQFADLELYNACQAQIPPKVSRFTHIGFKVGDAAYDELVSRLKVAGYAFSEREHGYCRSLYVKSPDDLELEFTVDPADIGQTMREKRASAHAELANWLAGDHRSNNKHVL